MYLPRTTTANRISNANRIKRQVGLFEKPAQNIIIQTKPYPILTISKFYAPSKRVSTVYA